MAFLEPVFSSSCTLPLYCSVRSTHNFSSEQQQLKNKLPFFITCHEITSKQQLTPFCAVKKKSKEQIQSLRNFSDSPSGSQSALAYQLFLSVEKVLYYYAYYFPAIKYTGVTKQLFV